MTASQPVPVLTTTVLAVLMRVAGPVPTEVHPHALGHPEQQVSARIGDAVVYLTEPTVAARIRQQWDAAQYLATHRLPERVSQTWLAPPWYVSGRCRATADRPGRGSHPVDHGPPAHPHPRALADP